MAICDDFQSRSQRNITFGKWETKTCLYVKRGSLQMETNFAASTSSHILLSHSLAFDLKQVWKFQKKFFFFHFCWGHISITQNRVIHWIFGTLHFGTLMSNIMTLNHLVRSFNPQETRFCRNTFLLLLPASHSPSFPFFVLARKLVRLKRKDFSGWSSCVTWYFGRWSPNSTVLHLFVV